MTVTAITPSPVSPACAGARPIRNQPAEVSIPTATMTEDLARRLLGLE